MSLAYIFPGQGSQKVGMLASFSDEKIANEHLTRASQVLGYDLKNLLQNGPEDRLNLTEFAQPAILVCSYIHYLSYKNRYPKQEVDFLAGHSLGEYTACLVGGAFDFESAVLAVSKRGKFMQNCIKPGVAGMAAIIGLDADAVNQAIAQVAADDYLKIANYNCPGQIVVSGHLNAIERLMAIVKGIKLPVSAPFHSELISGTKEQMAEFLHSINIADSSVSIVTNFAAKEVKKAIDIRHSLIEQITAPVLWQQSIEYMISQKATALIEFGHSKVLCNMIRRIDKELSCQLFSEPNSEITFN